MLRRANERTAKLLVTEECGRLTRWLRLMGYDTVQKKAVPLSRLYSQAYSENRIVITRNSRVRESCIFCVVRLASPHLEKQLGQLIKAVPISADNKQAFSRCDRCNVLVKPVEKSLMEKYIPPYVYKTQDKFHRCPGCGRIYWAATHWRRVRSLLDRVRKEANHA